MILHCLWCTPKNHFLIGQKILNDEIPLTIKHHHLLCFSQALKLMDKYAINCCFWGKSILNQPFKKVFELFPLGETVHFGLMEKETIPPEALHYEIFDWLRLPLKREHLTQNLIRGIGQQFHPNKKISSLRNTLVIPHSKSTKKYTFIELHKVCTIKQLDHTVMIENVDASKETFLLPLLWITIQLENSPNFFEVTPHFWINLNTVEEIFSDKNHNHYCQLSNDSEFKINPDEKRKIINYTELLARKTNGITSQDTPLIRDQIMKLFPMVNSM